MFYYVINICFEYKVQCVEVMEDALLDTKPLARYLAGPDTQTGVPVSFNNLSNFKLYLFSF